MWCLRVIVIPGAMIVITGAAGIVGSVLVKGLAPYFEVHGIDMPDDVTRYDALLTQLRGVHTVIHLARKRHLAGPSPPAAINPRNVEIDASVFGAAIEGGAKRIITASSVHADDFRSAETEPPLKVPGSYHPATPYGAYKLLGEEVGRILAARFGFEFVAVRLGGVTADDSVKEGPGRTATWLSHRDLVGAIRACLDYDPIPGRFIVFYAVSNNADRIHDTTNPFGWVPSDDAHRRR